MLTDTILEDANWQALALPDLAEQAARAALEHLCLDPAEYEIAILACDDARIATLNTEFRGKPAPTNVLSWPAADLAAETDGDRPGAPRAPELGDIAIALGTCQREAAEQGKPVQAHVTHLIVHGVLHLLGYDHLRDADATLMERLEREILGNLGLPDPYSETPGPTGPHTGQD